MYAAIQKTQTNEISGTLNVDLLKYQHQLNINWRKEAQYLKGYFPPRGQISYLFFCFYKISKRELFSILPNKSHSILSKFYPTWDPESLSHLLGIHTSWVIKNWEFELGFARWWFTESLDCLKGQLNYHNISFLILPQKSLQPKKYSEYTHLFLFRIGFPNYTKKALKFLFWQAWWQKEHPYPCYMGVKITQVEMILKSQTAWVSLKCRNETLQGCFISQNRRCNHWRVLHSSRTFL